MSILGNALSSFAGSLVPSSLSSFVSPSIISSGTKIYSALRSGSNSSSKNSSESLYDSLYKSLGDIQRANSAAQIDWMRENNKFQQQSAREAMAFEAQQAALDRLFQQSSADKAMEFSRSEAQAQRDYEERMSNSAYQRAMADLRAAGLNPILAYAHPASTPSVSAASGSKASGSKASGSKASGSNADIDSFSDIVGVLLASIGKIVGSASALFAALG